ncbi:sensor histidine kinase [Nonomuraea sp. NBC_01738]|uniref:sensor histidine kinase n=1 Tax=Nonomuraea sp. NBC_01738 TaxID=2976003 RepID=UPI002E148670|nr:sensor histidine kinase [Nonomuraea sp. NBC_01738]
MPADVPLEEPARGVISSGPHAWEKLWGWEVLLVLTVLVSSVYALLIKAPAGDKAVIVGCLLAMLPLYALFGRPAIVNEWHVRGMIHVAVLVVLFVPPALLLPETTFVLFGLLPQCFLALPTRLAVVGVVGLGVVAAVRPLLSGSPSSMFGLVVILTTVVFFSATFGLWIDRITQQSLDRARLITQLEESRAEVSRLSAEQGAQHERERLAGEIHDTLAQGFTSIIMLVQAAQKQSDPARHLALAVQTAKENLAEARALISALTPAPLDSSSLVEAMRRIAERTGDELDLTVGFEVRGEARALATPIDVVLIRALQEGLANVRKHAAAARVRVGLEYGTRHVRLSVTDDGTGFEPRDDDGFGLRTMRGRVEQAGGSLTVLSSAGQGTTLAVEVPA